MEFSKKVFQDVLWEILKIEGMIKKGWTFKDLYLYCNKTKWEARMVHDGEYFDFDTEYFTGTMKRLKYDNAKLTDGFDIWPNKEICKYKRFYKKEIIERAGIDINRIELIELLQELENSLEQVNYFMREKADYKVEEEFYANYEFEQSLSKMAMHTKYIKDRLMANDRREKLVEQYSELLLEADDVVSNGILKFAIEDIKKKME